MNTKNLLALLFFIPFIALAQVNEDFETSGAAGWSNGTFPTSGTFVLGDPTGTNWQVADDHTPTGTLAVYTGFNTGGADGTVDVDGGTATLLSPIYNIASTSTMSIWYFFGQRDNGDDAGDFFRLEYSLDGGTNFITLVAIGDVTTLPAWTEATAIIPAGSNVQIRMQAADGPSAGDIIEAGIDDITIVPNSPFLEIDDIAVDEDAGTATFTVTHSGSDTSGPFTITYETVGGTADQNIDYTAVTGGTLNFNGTAGDTEQIVITILTDTEVENAENYTIQFTATSDPSVVISDVGLGTINGNIAVNAPLTLFNEFNGYYDYALTGGSMRTEDVDVCAITTNSSNTLLTPVPATAVIERAYLFWAHSGATADLQVTFEGQTIDASFANQTNFGTLPFFSMIGDVTSLVSGITNLSTNTFDFSGLAVDNTGTYCSGTVVMGGWTLMVFYTDDSLPAVSINLYQGFSGEQNNTTSFTLDGFFAIGATGAKTSILSWEGDIGLANNELLSVTTSSGTTTLSGDGDNNGSTVNNPFNSTIYDNTVSPIINTTSFGLDLDTYDISPQISAGESTATTNVGVGQDFVMLNAVLLKVPSNLIVGNIFEDINYGGGAGRDMTTSGGVGIEGTRVELYDNTGSLEDTAISNATGEYSMGGMANGSYSVRVVSETVRSNRGGGSTCTTCLPIQTYRRDFTTGSGFTDFTNEIGGADPTAADVGINVLTNAQTVSNVSILSEGIIDLDFGFNFSTIVNTNEDDQGSLEQFIINSNNLDETGLDIEANGIFDPSTGEDTSVFMIPPTGDVLGRTADPNFASGIFDITISNGNPLSPITSSNTVIDGRTQTAYSGDTNGGTIGSGGTTVGVSGSVLPNYNLPEIQVHRNNGDVIQLQGSNTVIRNLSVYGGNRAALRVDNGSVTITNNLLGVTAQGVNGGNVDDGVEVLGGTAIIDGNYIATNTDAAVRINGGTSTIIRNNHITDNGTRNACQDNITIESGSGIVIQQNLIERSGSLGIDADDISGGLLITENTIRTSGQDGGSCNGNIENAGILLDGDNSSITNNIIASNGGSGIVLAGGNTSGNLISQNSIFANGTAGNALGIDIDASDNIGDGVTLNDNNDADNGPNGGLNFPIVSSVFISGSNLVIRGWSRPGATIEVFLTDVNEGTAIAGDNQLGLSTDYGEGQVFLGSMVEGSGDDSDAGTSTYTDVDGNTDTTNRYAFSIPISAGVTGNLITTTATLANSTSEFSPFSTIKVQTVITNRRITYRVNGN